LILALILFRPSIAEATFQSYAPQPTQALLVRVGVDSQSGAFLAQAFVRAPV